MTLLAILMIGLNPANAVFEQVQINWIADTRTVRNLEQAISAEDARLIRLLGNPDALIRTLAFEELARRGESVFTSLCWGTRISDPEIASRCKQLVHRLFSCRSCLGFGMCLACTDLENSNDCPDRCNWASRCNECSGSGDIRYFLGEIIWGELQPRIDRELWK